jgi:uncharacterized membrane protein YidH (DUF202 family)
MEEILIPISVCVVLPVMVVWLVNRTRQNEINRKADIMLKAIESGATIDANFFKAQQENKSIKERLLKRLTGACIFTLTGLVFAVIGLFNWTNLTENMSNDSAVIPMIFGGLFLAIGISLFVVFFVGRKMLAKEIEAEEKALENK